MSAIRQANDTDTGPITPVYALPIDHPSAWKPADFASPADYTIELTAGNATSITAIGDAVNTASRLESLTKNFACELVVSDETVSRAGLDLSGFPLHEIEIRGKREMLAVRTLTRASDLPRHGTIPVREIEPAKPAVAVLPADS